MALSRPNSKQPTIWGIQATNELQRISSTLGLLIYATMTAFFVSQK